MQQESTPPPSCLRAFCPILVLLLTLVLITSAFMYPPSFHYMSRAFIRVYSMGNEGLALFFLIYPISMAIGFPIAILDIVIGFLYPWKLGFIVAFLGKAIGCAFCYCVAGIILKDSFQAWAKHQSFLQKLKILMRRFPWKYCFLLRIIYVSSTVKNYGLAALEVPFIPYFVSSLVLTFFTSMWQVTLGREGKTLVQAMDVKLSKEEVSFLILAGAVSLGAIIALVLYTRKFINSIDEQQELREAGPQSTHEEPQAFA